MSFDLLEQPAAISSGDAVSDEGRLPSFWDLAASLAGEFGQILQENAANPAMPAAPLSAMADTLDAVDADPGVLLDAFPGADGHAVLAVIETVEEGGGAVVFGDAEGGSLSGTDGGDVLIGGGAVLDADALLDLLAADMPFVDDFAV